MGSQQAKEAPHGATRDLLLDAAERLFAAHGINGVSLREIGLAAHQRNNGVAQYHFGDKAGLVRAVFERRAAVVNDRRLELLDEVARRPGGAVTDLIRAFVEPLGEQVQRGNWYVPFLSRLQAEHRRDELLRPVDDKVNTGFIRFRRELRDRLAALPADLFANRLRLAVNLAIDALADHQARLVNSEPRTLPLPRFVDDLVNAISGLLTAPGSRPD
jgi:AcrR family transcriptional regulator